MRGTQATRVVCCPLWAGGVLGLPAHQRWTQQGLRSPGKGACASGATSRQALPNPGHPGRAEPWVVTEPHHGPPHPRQPGAIWWGGPPATLPHPVRNNQHLLSPAHGLPATHSLWPHVCTLLRESAGFQVDTHSGSRARARPWSSHSIRSENTRSPPDRTSFNPEICAVLRASEQNC